jgi:thiamine kinase
MSPGEIAAQALGVAPADVESVEPITHGLTNRSWLVRAGADAVVVRVSPPAEAALQIDRRSEYLVLHAVAAADIGAPVLLDDPAQHILVTKYLGSVWTFEEASVARNIARLGALLSRLHRLAVPPGVRFVDLAESVDGYIATLSALDVHSALRAEERRTRARQIVASLSASSISCLCHNDIHHLNVVDDGAALRLIDWEYAGTGTPLFDLASVCVYHSYALTARDELLSVYGRGSREELEEACWLFEYVRDLWYAVREITLT